MFIFWISIFSSRQKHCRVKELFEADSKEILLASRVSERRVVKKNLVDKMPSISGWNLKALQVLHSGNKDPLLETSSEACGLSNNENSFMETSSKGNGGNCFSSSSSTACYLLSNENSDNGDHLQCPFSCLWGNTRTLSI